jgi:hypothetical protein
MIDGLTHIIRKNVEFGFQFNEEVERAREARDSLHNLYELPPVKNSSEMEKQLAELMGRPSSPYDSHPAPRDRIALIQQINVRGFFDYDLRPAIDLIPNAGRIQEEFTANIEERLRQQDVLVTENPG